MKRSTLGVLLCLLVLGLTACDGLEGDPIIIPSPDATDDPRPDTSDEPDLPGAPDQGTDTNPAPDTGPEDSGPDLPPEGDMADPDPVFTGQLPATRVLEEGRFVTAAACAECHSTSPGAQAMRDSFGGSVAPYDLWRSSMMGLASRDPFWRATVSAEMVATPDQAEVIEQICLKCHAPMGVVHAEDTGQTVRTNTLDNDTPLAQLSLDGVSCAFCHQMTADNFGEEASFTGGYTVNNERAIYGPFDDPLTTPMQENVGYTPQLGEHITEGDLCGTCHVVYTPTMLPNGELAGIIFPEQTTYLEWRNSSYNTGVNAGPKARPCIDCHMPNTDEIGTNLNTKIARRPDGGDFEQIPERSPVRRHIWVGSNLTMVEMMRDARDELAPTVPVAAFEQTLRDTRKHLTTNAGHVEILSATCSDNVCTIRVRAFHDTGHKFPTGYPSRRAWLRVQLLDNQGQVLFTSGDFDNRGRILGPDGQILSTENVGGLTQPHHQTITTGDQVQIYESIMSDTQGQPTVTLMRAADYIKDNRLLPEGFSYTHPDAGPILPIGIAQDGDFNNRQDITTYRITLPPGAQASRATAAMQFQTLGARYMDELFAFQTPEIEYFRDLYERTDTRPLTMDEDESNVFNQ